MFLPTCKINYTSPKLLNDKVLVSIKYRKKKTESYNQQSLTSALKKQLDIKIACGSREFYGMKKIPTLSSQLAATAL